ncbi:MAG TPA: hypothetical protein VMJ10_27845 [Kofleriaceae bacterium]|nr:hypothetical protein [Kofleriaceae bacterium]
MMLRASLAISIFASLTACASSDVSTMRMGGVFPPRPSNSQLELRNQTLNYELTSNYDTVGTVMIRGEANEPPNSPRLLALLKPQACSLGGELVLVNTSATVSYPGTLRGDDSHHSYLVMRKKSAQTPTSQTF